jgi:hypothetical protein
MQETAAPSSPCDIPLWAIARDSRHALSVEGLSQRSVKVPRVAHVGVKNTFENGPDSGVEEAEVKIVTASKGTCPWTKDSILLGYPYGGTESHLATDRDSEQLTTGRRYIVFSIGDERRDQVLRKESPIRLDRCGVWEDTPENRRELEKGFKRNDELRGAELR